MYNSRICIFHHLEKELRIVQCPDTVFLSHLIRLKIYKTPENMRLVVLIERHLLSINIKLIMYS